MFMPTTRTDHADFVGEYPILRALPDPATADYRRNGPNMAVRLLDQACAILNGHPDPDTTDRENDLRGELEDLSRRAPTDARTDRCDALRRMIADLRFEQCLGCLQLIFEPNSPYGLREHPPEEGQPRDTFGDFIAYALEAWARDSTPQGRGVPAARVAGVIDSWGLYDDNRIVTPQVYADAAASLLAEQISRTIDELELHVDGAIITPRVHADVVAAIRDRRAKKAAPRVDDAYARVSTRASERHLYRLSDLIAGAYRPPRGRAAPPPDSPQTDSSSTLPELCRAHVGWMRTVTRLDALLAHELAQVAG